MDYKYLVESGKYKKEDLTADHRHYIDGLERALVVADKFVANFLENEEESTLEKIERETREATIEEFKNYLGIEICEMIVWMLDEQDEEPEG